MKSLKNNWFQMSSKTFQSPRYILIPILMAVFVDINATTMVFLETFYQWGGNDLLEAMWTHPYLVAIVFAIHVLLLFMAVDAEHNERRAWATGIVSFINWYWAVGMVKWEGSFLNATNMGSALITVLWALMIGFTFYHAPYAFVEALRAREREQELSSRAGELEEEIEARESRVIELGKEIAGREKALSHAERLAKEATVYTKELEEDVADWETRLSQHESHAKDLEKIIKERESVLSQVESRAKEAAVAGKEERLALADMLAELMDKDQDSKSIRRNIQNAYKRIVQNGLTPEAKGMEYAKITLYQAIQRKRGEMEFDPWKGGPNG